MVQIFVIYHKVLEDCNVFVTDLSNVSKVIDDMCIETKTKKSEWDYRVLTEGIKFVADMASF
jgi:hypothetical protein